jgi:hypothetical protein
MRCSYHTEIEPDGTCVICGKLICRDCQTLYNEKSYCKDCIKIVLSGNVLKENWFERHLNWTLFLSEFGITLLVFFLAFVGGNLRTGRIIFAIVFWAIYLGLTFLDLGWYLRKKNRNLAWMLMWFVPIGWIIILCLVNKSPDHYNESEEKARREKGKLEQQQLSDEIRQIREQYPNRRI